MKTTLHKSNTRGHADHGWLDTYHTFSFAGYQDPERMNFGALRVLNDDKLASGRGFGTHPHQDMEIISIPLSGDLEHEDSMDNKGVITEGEIQVMSAGTGIQHSEYNINADKDVQFLQIWVFPREQGVTPRYDQISITDLHQENTFYQVLSPNENDQGVWVHQDAWFSIGDFTAETAGEYKLNKTGDGVYFFVLEGEIEIEGQKLSKRDGIAVSDTDKIKYSASKNAKVLLMEVPMQF